MTVLSLPSFQFVPLNFFAPPTDGDNFSIFFFFLETVHLLVVTLDSRKKKGRLRIPGIFRFFFFFFLHWGCLVAISRFQHTCAQKRTHTHACVQPVIGSSLWGFYPTRGPKLLGCSLETSCAYLPNIQMALGTTRCEC